MTQRPALETVQVVKQRRDTALRALTDGIPYLNYLGVEFDRRGDELTAVLPYRDDLIGNPMLPALHGGATAAFLEITSIIVLSWSIIWPEFEKGDLTVDGHSPLPRLPRTIGFTVDYLRTGLPRDSYARARVVRAGRRYSSVHVEGWQDNRDRPFIQASGRFLMPQSHG